MTGEKKSLQALAEELGFPFFLCDETLSRWSQPSSSLISLFQVQGESRDNPQFWRDSLAVSYEVFLKKAASLRGNPGRICLPLSFNLGEEGNVPVNVKFSSLKRGEDGIPYRVGFLERENPDIHYKREAIQARDNEIEISARIQKILLTEAVPHSLKGVDVAAQTIPSREVDGDFYEFLPLAPGITDFIIGDVMGKGVPAALMAAAVKASYYKSLIRRGVGEERRDIKTVLEMVDDLVGTNLMDLGKFLTLYYCRLDTEKSLLHFIDAGHTPFLYYDKTDGSCWSVKGANMPMGFVGGQDYRPFLLPFARGDLLLFYSDGVTEVKNSEGDMFGTERLQLLVKAHGYLSPEDLLKKVINVIFFYSEGSFDDDVTAVALRITAEEPHPEKEKFFSLERGNSSSLEMIRETFLRDLEDVLGTEREEISLKLTIALMEACSNSISYTRENILLSWKISTVRAVISLEFFGPDFDWSRREDPRMEDYRENGYGSFLIGGGTDSSLLLQSGEKRKKLVLVKEFP